MHPKEIENILKLTPFERYQYFIRKIADWEIAYSLIFLDGNYAISTIDDKKMFKIEIFEDKGERSLEFNITSDIITSAKSIQ